MQSNSSNRKLELKKLSDSYDSKYKKLQNILDIKFATYNKEACVATLTDYEVLITLVDNLREDTSIKPKMRVKLNILFNRLGFKKFA